MTNDDVLLLEGTLSFSNNESINTQ